MWDLIVSVPDHCLSFYFDFDIVNFPFLDGDVPHSTSYAVYISHLIRLARVSSHVAGFNARIKRFNCQTFPTGLPVS